LDETDKNIPRTEMIRDDEAGCTCVNGIPDDGVPGGTAAFHFLGDCFRVYESKDRFFDYRGTPVAGLGSVISESFSRLSLFGYYMPLLLRSSSANPFLSQLSMKGKMLRNESSILI
jgi:hypothetical protein